MSERRFVVDDLVEYSMGVGIVTDVKESAGIFLYEMQDEHGKTSCPDRPEYRMKLVEQDVGLRRLRIENALLRNQLRELQLILYRRGYRGPEIKEKW